MRKKITSALAALALGFGLGLGGATHAATGVNVDDVAFSFEGPFGAYDRQQLQRGLQIYTEICAACHGLQYVPVRSLAEPGGPELPEDQVRAYADMLEPIYFADGTDRPREASDNFPARTEEGMGPDLSLMAKARAGFSGPYGTGLNQLFRGMGGSEYIHALLTGYTGDYREEAGALFFENTAFPGGWIAMAEPLFEGFVEYADGTDATLEQMSLDVSAFLMWAAEPQMMARKRAGFVGVLLLGLLAVLLYLTNKRLWAPHIRDA